MTWKELRSKIDKAVKESGKKPSEIEIWYIDIDSRATVELVDVHIEDRHHKNEFEMWID